MQYRKLGRTDIDVSVIGLGTMTWGEQNTEADAFSQMDFALERGVNLFDAAEMYPVPPKPETQGLTEEYIGNWLNRSGRRDDIVLATKASGPGAKHIREGRPSFDAEGLTAALEGSLKRLRTDHVDLYQLHWPERRANFFGRLGFEAPEEETSPRIEETLRALAGLVESGKVRHIGLSNETPWGVMEFLRLAEKYDLPRVVSVQNPYNLINRSYEVGLAEVSWREDCGLLAYSPLAFGALSGKYLNGARPEGARMTLFTRFSRYFNEPGEQATAAYVDLAREHGLDVVQMALAFANSRPFLTSTLVGATSLEQLRTNIGSIDVTLSDEVLEGIEAIHTRHPNPCP